MFERDEMI